MRVAVALLTLLLYLSAGAGGQRSRGKLIPDEETAKEFARIVMRVRVGVPNADFTGTLLNGHWVLYWTHNGVEPDVEVEDIAIVLDAYSGRVIYAGISNVKPRMNADIKRLPSDNRGMLIDGDQAQAISAVWARYKQGPNRGPAKLKDYTADVRKSADGFEVILYFSKEGGLCRWPGVRYRVDRKGIAHALGLIPPTLKTEEFH
jgi:hypothetical protein